eukprot:gnl/Dysnectes_brevis/902_a1001_2287.p1 GENE.gnl/Dysnectes_brevis/902_a1001_2287~~gnl/Dysnectes_brevis/902_a1001_2287.p1  ORF type:complete len:544 (-),score=114.44 gnl/Dysnectes_brevis/902_a1001_2287:46-1677(-)
MGSYSLIYTILSVVTVIVAFLAYFVHSLFALRAGRSTHAAMVHSILRAPLSFFQKTPVGRIMNRLSSDLDAVDDTLFTTSKDVLSSFANMVATVSLIIYSAPIVLLLIIPLLFVYRYLMKVFRPARRAVKRLSSTSKSPVLAKSAELLSGLDTVRAYSRQRHFTQEFENSVNSYVCSEYAGISVQHWLLVRTKGIGILIGGVSAPLLGLSISRQGLSYTLAALCLSLSSSLVYRLGYLVRITADAEAALNAVERVEEYTNLPSESQTQNTPGEDWPPRGDLQITDLTVIYRPDHPPAVDAVSFHVPAGSRAALIGRSASGKSSIASSLLRLHEPASGSLKLDGVELRDISLRSLRKAICLVPQAPSLTSGSLRAALDPHGMHTLEQQMEVLQRVGLGELLRSRGVESPQDFELGPGGGNLSGGERQLVCLAAAMLRGSKLVILDEASASVDHATDIKLQLAIRQQFASCTVLTVAHRLNTIVDYDVAIVLSHGKLAEMDTPANLLRDSTSMFSDMVRETGEEESARLHQLAFDAERKREHPLE